MKKRKRKVKYKNVGILFGIIVLVVIVFNLMGKKHEITNEDVLKFVGKNISELEQNFMDEDISINKEYEYNDKYLKDEVINLEYQNKTIKAIISKGKPDKELYREKKVNELGNVPIMMYHGIVDTLDNKYTGGNVDKDGYNRTTKAFREDLEFYYSKGYRMIRLNDYVNGVVDVELGYSPLILTFDDGDKNNINILGRNSDGTLIIDPNSAVGILEEFKKKHPDMHVTATFFVMDGLFNQSSYNEEILNWLVDNGYDIGNHTTIHPDFTTISVAKTQEVVGKMYQKLDKYLKDKYVKIVALPFGSPYKKTHENYPYILKGSYEGYDYETLAALRVGWEPELSPFNKNFDKTFLKRCRAYDNNGKEFDIEMVFKNLEKNRYISDGNKDQIVIREKDRDNINIDFKNIVVYKESE